jgi:hypothetical protein
MSMLCEHKETITTVECDDERDVTRVICKKCNMTLKQTVAGEAAATEPGSMPIVAEGDIESIKQQVAARKIAPGFDPANLRRGDEGDGQVVVKGAKVQPKALPTAAELAELAERVQTERQEAAITSIVTDILAKAQADVLAGKKESEYTIEQDRCNGAIIRLVLADLRDRGYTPKREAVPGKGTRIELRWKKQKPTRKKSAKRSPGRPKKVRTPTQSSSN